MSDSALAPGEASEEYWRDFLLNGDPRERSLRRLLAHLPHGPRCKACGMPFAGLGRQALRLVGKHQSTRNPNLCNSCFDHLIAPKAGATIEITMLFADVRGSTT